LVITVFNLIVHLFADGIIVMQNLHGECNSIWNPLERELLDNTYTLKSHSEQQVCKTLINSQLSMNCSAIDLFFRYESYF